MLLVASALVLHELHLVHHLVDSVVVELVRLLVFGFVWARSDDISSSQFVKFGFELSFERLNS